MNITEDWIDSDSALANAEAYGGKEFREQNPDHSISAVLNQALVPDSHPYWCITYKSDTEESITFMKCIDAEKAITSSDESSLAPMEFQLYQNYPNPFNPNTKIKYRIPYNVSAMNDVNQSYKVTLKIFDILGNETAELVNRDQFPGEYEIEFSQEQISSGIYFYVLSAGNKNLSRKMILLR